MPCTLKPLKSNKSSASLCMPCTLKPLESNKSSASLFNLFISKTLGSYISSVP